MNKVSNIIMIAVLESVPIATVIALIVAIFKIKKKK